jgi:hypothetical protein
MSLPRTSRSRRSLDRRVPRSREAHQRHDRDRLAGSRLADDGHDLATSDPERDTVDGVHQAVLGTERNLEILDGEERLAGLRGGRRARRCVHEKVRMRGSTAA